MMMIDLRPGCLDAPTVLDVAVVMAAMLWPDHKLLPNATELRHRYMAAEVGRVGPWVLDHVPLPTPSPSEVRAAVEAIRDMPRMSDCPIAEAYRNGMIAGGILGAVVGDGATLTEAKAMIAGRFNMTPKRLDNHVWPIWRPVAHLWCAYLHVAAAAGEPPQVICEPANLGRFLAGAEAWRRRGERTKSAPTAGMVLTWGQAARLPDHVVLPSTTAA